MKLAPLAAPVRLLRSTSWLQPRLLASLVLLPLACQDAPDEDGARQDPVVGGDAAPPSLARAPRPDPPVLRVPVAENALPPLAERDNQGRPLLYYGRVAVSDPAQPRLLRAFGFVDDTAPFFDDYDPREVRDGAPKPPAPTVWVYAIASGTQWNFLRRYPGLVDAMEMNPRLGNGPHPALDSFLPADLGGALDTDKLIAAGFTMQRLKLRSACVNPAGPSGLVGVRPQGFFDDFVGGVVEFFEDAGSALGQLIAKGTGLVGSELAEVVRAAVNGAQEAIDFIRELANSGYCIIQGSHSNGGVVFVRDNNGLVPDLGTNAAAPIRSGTMRARGGALNLLHTEAPIQHDGRYVFDDICNDTEYHLAVEFDSEVAFLTTDGVTKASADVTGTGGLDENATDSRWELGTQGAIWFMGAQLGRDFAIQELDFAPKPVQINYGFAAEDVIGGLNGHRSVATCNQQELVLGAIVGAYSPVGLPLATVFSADIFGVSSGAFVPNKASWVGVAVHEYGHYVFCEALDRYGTLGAKQTYVAGLLKTLLTTSGSDAQQIDEVRNSAEAWADLFAYRATGFTDYVKPTVPGLPAQRGSNLCATSVNAVSSTSGSVCFEPDAAYPLPAAVSEWPATLASRISIMSDWVDTPNADDDRLRVEMAAMLSAATSGTLQITTETIAAAITSAPPTPGAQPLASAEDVCAVFLRHGWPCDTVARGAVLDAPTNFAGASLDTTSIRWTWSPTSALATGYGLLQPVGDAWLPVYPLDLPANTFDVLQQVPDTGGNARVVAAVEARRAGSAPARSVAVVRCTRTRGVSVGSGTATPQGVALTWTAVNATSFRIRRRPVGGTFAEIARVPSTNEAQQTLIDTGAPPGTALEYIVDSVNCNGDITEGAGPFGVASVVDDPAAIYVRSGAIGGNGSRLAPVGTLAEARALVDGTRRKLVLASALYAESISLFGTAPVSIFGGYNADFTVRDVAANVTILAGGDGTSNLVSEGTGEFQTFFNPMLLGDFGGRLLVDGIVFAPGGRACTSGCAALDFFYGGRLELVNSTLLADPFGTTGPSRVPVIKARSCALENSTVDGLDSNNRTMVACGDADLSRSEVFAGVGGTALDATNARVTASVLRGTSDAWSPAPAPPQPGSTGVQATGCLLLRSSIVAGSTAVNVTARDLASCGPERWGIFRTLTYGDVWLTKVRAVDSVFLGEREGFFRVQLPDLCFGQCPGDVATANVVRNNLFLAVGGPGVAATPHREINGLGLLPGSEINDASAWFGPFANDVRDNRIVNSLAGVFDTAVTGPNGPVELDPTWRGNRARVLHFEPAFDRYFGIPLEDFGLPPGLTLDGNQSGDFGVGPYE